MSRPRVIGSVAIDYSSVDLDYVVCCFIVSADLEYVVG